MSLHDQEFSAIAHLQEALLVLGKKPDVARTIWQKQRPAGRPVRRKTEGRREGEVETGEPSQTEAKEGAEPATSPEMSSEEVAQA